MFTDNHDILTTVNLVWGVKGFYYDKHISTDHTINDIKEFLKEKGLVNLSEYIINISSIPLSEKGKSNMIKISVVD